MWIYVKWKLSLFCIIFGPIVCQAYVDLYVKSQEVVSFLGMAADLYYVRNGQLNEQATHYIFTVPENIRDISLTWQSLAGRPIPYVISATTSDTNILPSPVINIPKNGNIPIQPQTFSISTVCTNIDADADQPTEVLITIRITIKRSATNFTEVVFSRRKQCNDNLSKNLNFNSSTTDYDKSSLAVFVTSAISLIIIFLLTCCAFCTRATPPKRKNSLFVRNSSFLRFQNHLPSTTESVSASANAAAAAAAAATIATLRKTDGCSDAEELHNRIIELTVQRCRVRLSNLLQEGTFGRVYRGTYNEWQDVLVKTVAVHADQSQISMLLQEGISLYGASHDGILSVLGVCLEDHATPFLLYSAPNGMQNLKLFLQEPISRTLTSIQIVNMSSQLVSALIHLHSHGVVHRDIAARNCVVDNQLRIKLTDSSLSRDLFPSDYSCLGDSENRPIKWLSLEALHKKLFTEASDAWAFGVLMWELCTLARQPYQEIVDDEMEQFLRNGYRLAQPLNCPDELFAIMAYCWALSPLERPTFGQLEVCLHDFFTQITRYV